MIHKVIPLLSAISAMVLVPQLAEMYRSVLVCDEKMFSVDCGVFCGCRWARTAWHGIKSASGDKVWRVHQNPGGSYPVNVV